MEAIGRLAGGIAHDFNNLLTVINGYCSLLLQRTSESASGHQEIRHILKAGESAAALTTRLLAFGRKQVLQPTVLNLNDIVSGLQTMLHRLIGERVELALDLDTDVGAVIADPAQIEQVVSLVGAERLGANAAFSKPLDFPALLARIRELTK